ncbi:MAG: hypothetical protein AB4080_16835 [Trichodesmium sp.]
MLGVGDSYTGDRRQETGDRRQETGDRRNGNYREGSRQNCPKIFLPSSSSNTSFLQLYRWKQGHFF